MAIDNELDEDLIAEGISREFVNRVQNMRKNNKLEVTDRIKVSVNSDEQLIKYLTKFNEYITNEILADTIEYDNTLDGYKEELSIGDFKCEITISKVI